MKELSIREKEMLKEALKEYGESLIEFLIETDNNDKREWRYAKKLRRQSNKLIKKLAL